MDDKDRIEKARLRVDAAAVELALAGMALQKIDESGMLCTVPDRRLEYMISDAQNFCNDISIYIAERREPGKPQ